MDNRVIEHARILVDHSISASEGDSVLITAHPDAEPLVSALYDQLGAIGAMPTTLWWYDKNLTQTLLQSWPEGRGFEAPSPHLAALEAADAYIGIKAPRNRHEWRNVSDSKANSYNDAIGPLITEQVQTNWVVTHHPTPALAQIAGMSTEAYADFVYDSVCKDWNEQEEYQLQLAELLEDAEIHIVSGDETDLKAQIGDVGGENPGTHNLPCGEVGTSPHWKSVEGTVSFDYPVFIDGKLVSGIQLTFDEGEVVAFSADENESALESLLNTDEGASRVGEIGFGMNHDIDRYTTNIYFDEKMAKTIHLALGFAYADGPEYNESSAHTDIVLDMRESSYIEADGETIFRNGNYVFDEEFDD